MLKQGHILIAVVAIVLAGCAGKPFKYHAIDDMKQGPGVFTNEENGYTVFDTEKKQVAAVSVEAQDGEAFRDFQDYKKWKRQPSSVNQQKEFQEWREWKAYRAWKDKQQ